MHGLDTPCSVLACRACVCVWFQGKLDLCMRNVCSRTELCSRKAVGSLRPTLDPQQACMPMVLSPGQCLPAPTLERRSLSQPHADMEAGESTQPGLRLQAGQSPFGSPQARLPGSILKGLAPRALIASPEGSPHAGDMDEAWNTLAEVPSHAPHMVGDSYKGAVAQS